MRWRRYRDEGNRASLSDCQKFVSTAIKWYEFCDSRLSFHKFFLFLGSRRVLIFPESFQHRGHYQR